MIYRLLPEQVPVYWDTIKYAATQANRLTTDAKLPVYLTNLLANIMSEKTQVWLCVSEDKTIKTVLLTRIFKDAGDMPHLMIDVAYGYAPTTEADKADYIGLMNDFAKSQDCGTVFAYTSNTIAANAMVKMGMAEAFRVFQKEVT